MVSIEGVDYSVGAPGGAALKAAGKRFVVRYLVSMARRWAGDGRGITAAEYADLVTHGIEVAVVYEGRADRALDGREAGKVDAAYAQAALEEHGLPARMPIYFAADDFGAETAWHFNMIDQYLGGCTEVVGLERTGVYGGIRTIRHCQQADTARWFWQTYAWSGGQVAPGIHLYQYDNYGNTINGVDVDYNRAFQENYGQASRFIVAPEFPTPPTPEPETPKVIPFEQFLHGLRTRRTQYQRDPETGKTIKFYYIVHTFQVMPDRIAVLRKGIGKDKEVVERLEGGATVESAFIVRMPPVGDQKPLEWLITKDGLAAQYNVFTEDIPLDIPRRT